MPVVLGVQYQEMHMKCIKMPRPNKKYFSFLFLSIPKKLDVPKTFIEHLKKKVFISNILVPNVENRMKIGRELAEIWMKNRTH
jgi:hypothetical protein